MLKRLILSGLLLSSVACEALPPAPSDGPLSGDGLPACPGETLLAFDCGPEDAPLYDNRGRKLATCYMDSDGDHTLVNRNVECVVADFHCMPETYCRPRCQDGQETCPTATTSWQ